MEGRAEGTYRWFREMFETIYRQAYFSYRFYIPRTGKRVYIGVGINPRYGVEIRFGYRRSKW